jgi:hypothetical protein
MGSKKKRRKAAKKSKKKTTASPKDPLSPEDRAWIDGIAQDPEAVARVRRRDEAADEFKLISDNVRASFCFDCPGRKMHVYFFDADGKMISEQMSPTPFVDLG